MGNAFLKSKKYCPSHIALHGNPPLSSALLKEKQDEFEAEVQADKERKRIISLDLVPVEGVPLGFSIHAEMKEPERLLIDTVLIGNVIKDSIVDRTMRTKFETEFCDSQAICNSYLTHVKIGDSTNPVQSMTRNEFLDALKRDCCVTIALDIHKVPTSLLNLGSNRPKYENWPLKSNLDMLAEAARNM